MGRCNTDVEAERAWEGCSISRMSESTYKVKLASWWGVHRFIHHYTPHLALA